MDGRQNRPTNQCCCHPYLPVLSPAAHAFPCRPLWPPSDTPRSHRDV
jgi:hypothetical protein